MEYIPKEDKENFNAPKEPFLTSSLKLLFGLLLSLLCLYLFLGITSELLVRIAPKETEKILSKVVNSSFYKSNYLSPELIKKQEKLRKIALSMTSFLGEEPVDVYIKDEDIFNAYALPGRKIVLFTGLIDELKSEEAISMVLGHEIAHIANYDVIRSFGRRALLYLLLSLVLNDESGGQLAASLVNFSELTFSRKQESKADNLGLELLNNYSGHVGGATKFFEIASKEEGFTKYMDFLSTHPASDKRIEIIKSLIEEKNYKVSQTKEF